MFRLFFMIIEFSKDLYAKEALIKAAYSFTDRAYIKLGQSDDNYLFEYSFKDGCHFDPGEVENEMLFQTARHQVFLETKELRKIIVARAMASTIVGDETIDESKSTENEKDILRNWFDNEQS